MVTSCRWRPDIIVVIRCSCCAEIEIIKLGVRRGCETVGQCGGVISTSVRGYHRSIDIRSGGVGAVPVVKNRDDLSGRVNCPETCLAGDSVQSASLIERLKKIRFFGETSRKVCGSFVENSWCETHGEVERKRADCITVFELKVSICDERVVQGSVGFEVIGRAWCD